jgi:hypothetical protein
MSNRNYVCSRCGALRRAPQVYRNPRKESLAEAQASKRWPKHCDRPMIRLPFVQAEAATQITPEERVKWIAKGAHVLKRGGKHTWRPVTSDWQIEEARREYLDFVMSSFHTNSET